MEGHAQSVFRREIAAHRSFVSKQTVRFELPSVVGTQSHLFAMVAQLIEERFLHLGLVRGQHHAVVFEVDRVF